MITEEQRNSLKELGKTSYGKHLKEYLAEKYKEMNSVLKVTSWEDALGKKHALTILKDLFSILEEEKKNDTMKNKSSFE